MGCDSHGKCYGRSLRLGRAARAVTKGPAGCIGTQGPYALGPGQPKQCPTTVSIISRGTMLVANGTGCVPEFAILFFSG